MKKIRVYAGYWLNWSDISLFRFDIDEEGKLVLHLKLSGTEDVIAPDDGRLLRSATDTIVLAWSTFYDMRRLLKEVVLRFEAFIATKDIVYLDSLVAGSCKTLDDENKHTQ